MKTWEDIIKDKMEALDETLPESAFAQFEAIRNGSTREPKRFPLLWALAPAVASVLAAVLLLHKSSEYGEGVEVVYQPSIPVVDNIDIVNDVETNTVELSQPQAMPLLTSHAVMPIITSQPDVQTQGPTVTEEPAHLEETEAKVQEIEYNSLETETPAMLENHSVTKPFKVKIAPVAGIIAGGSLAAALISPFVSGYKMDALPNPQSSPSDVHYGDSEPPEDVLTENPWHYFPLKAGLTTRIPVTEKMNLTTGIDYSLYSSIYKYSISGNHRQLSQYVGIPLRLDWTLASSRLFELYLGGGLKGEFCVGASYDGRMIKKDGFSVSLLGSGGVQFNITDHIGLYIEPDLSWMLPSNNHTLENYRNNNPVMLSVSTGIRIK